MHTFAILSAIALAALLIWRWSASRQSKTGGWLFALAAVAVATGLWGVSIHVAGLPRAATALPGQSDLVYEVLAASSEEAWLVSDAVVRISLPEGRITARYPDPDGKPRVDLGVLTSVSAGRGVLLFTYFHGAGQGGWAALRDDAWLVAPHPSKMGQAPLTSFWDEARGRFMLASFLRPVSVEPSAGDVREGWRQPVALESVGLDGRVREEPALRFSTQLPGLDAMCRVGERLYAGDVSLRVCRLEEDAAGAMACLPVEGAQGKRVVCPGQVFRLAPRAFLSGQGIVALPMPPRSFFERQEPVPSLAYARLTPKGLRPQFVWYTKDGGSVARFGEVSLSARFVDQEEVRALGHVEHETLIQIWDVEGRLLAETYVRSMTLPILIFEAGAELVVLAKDLSSVVRLDRKTLVRLDAPCPVQAVRERLRVWGGPSVLFEGALAFGLLAILIVLLFAAGQALRAGREASRFTLQRVALVYLLVAAPALLELISRAWHL